MAAPQRTIVYRLKHFSFSVDAPGQFALDLTVTVGYLDDGGAFVPVIDQSFVVGDSAGKTIFYGNPDSSVQRVEDIRAALAEYLISNQIIQGELVE